MINQDKNIFLTPHKYRNKIETIADDLHSYREKCNFYSWYDQNETQYFLKYLIARKIEAINQLIYVKRDDASFLIEKKANIDILNEIISMIEIYDKEET